MRNVEITDRYYGVYYSTVVLTIQFTKTFASDLNAAINAEHQRLLGRAYETEPNVRLIFSSVGFPLSASGGGFCALLVYAHAPAEGLPKEAAE